MKGDFDGIIDMTGTGSVKWELTQKVFGEESLTPMWVADMDFRGPQAVIDALKRRAELGVYGYTFRPAHLNEAVAGWMERRHGWRVDQEWICFSPGVVTALNACVQVYTEPGDRVIIQPPVYPPFFKSVQDHGREPVMNPLKLVDGKYEMDFEDLAAKAETSRAKMLLLCNPHNPVGRVWTRGELEKLAAICERFGLIVVADEIHADLALNPHRHTPLLVAAPQLAGRTIVCMAPSKTFNMAGLAMSFVLIPDPEQRKAFQTFMEKAHLTAINPFSLTAADAAYRHGDEWLDRVLAYIKGNAEYLRDFLTRRIPRLSMVMPEGTYMAWIDCRPLGLAPDELKAFMVSKAKVALNEGKGFGEEGAGFMRMNLAAPRSVLEEALAKIEAAVNAL
ncbi:MalY/PatB family protein [Cohnella caldifontis]|uniref:MalY/PatB family protein n=1 Tax=Cohnella caldifontis TaxID=3027471 RepID=UPI0023EB294C|nr:PatB family C-S lyase [Cohnella sp. YIM B05605]